MMNVKKICKISFIGLFVLGTLCFINFIPTFSLKSSHMAVLEGSWVNVYYETEKLAAEDVFKCADFNTKYIAEKLGFSEKKNINIYVYDYQRTMQRKKYGFIGSMVGLDLVYR